MLTFIHGGYLYDFPELLLLLCGTLFIVKGRWTAYYAVLLMATLNKETGMFLTAYFVALRWDSLPRLKLFSHVAAQGLLSVAVILAVRIYFSENPGVLTESRPLEHLVTWTDPRSYIRFFDFVSPLVFIPRATNILFLMLLAGLLYQGWSMMTSSLRRFLGLILFVNVGLVLVGGYPDEVRNFSLLFTPLFIASAVGVWAMYSRTGAHQPPTGGSF
jgi:hypothetical protein